MKKQIIKALSVVLCAAVVTSAVPVGTGQPVTARAAAYTEDDAVSLKYVTSVDASEEGRVLRIYGDRDAAYNIPINISADCTVILDNIKTTADLTVADGKEVSIILRGNNQLGNIRATGGSATLVRIIGETDGGTLTTNDIACSAGGTAQTGANVSIENCSVFCRNLGCGADGADAAAWEGSASVAHATPGSNASPQVTVHGSNLAVSGSMACGGNGVCSTGTWSATSSAGGYSGAVEISGSYVTVGGNVAIGGKGGKGQMGTSYYNCKAGETRSSSSVTITDNSSVNVAGNVASQPDLPGYSNEGSQSGLHGVTVTVTDSTLSAKDIASGGAGHAQVHYSVYSGSGTSYDIYGTAGGNGGRLIADNAVINCERAVCGANAGEYQNYEVSMYGNTSGDVESARHPQDGRGGSILATNSVLTVKGCAAAKGTRWDGYPNPSVYADSTLIGGTLNGTVYGNVITTDATSIIGGGFTASEIRNSEEASCAKCVLKTDEALAGETVCVDANGLGGTVMLGSDGSMTTYLGIGKEVVKLTGAGVYSGTFMVKRSETLNIFQLAPYGIINISYDGATIRDGSYTHTNETYDYDGDYSICGESDTEGVKVEEGTHNITLDNVAMAELFVASGADVTLVLKGENHVGTVTVEKGGKLTILGDGSLTTDYLGGDSGADSGAIKILEGTVTAGVIGSGTDPEKVIISGGATVDAGTIHAPLENETGASIYKVTFDTGLAGEISFTCDGSTEEITLPEGGASFSRFLKSGTHDVEIKKDNLTYKGNVKVSEHATVYLDDLMLYLDISNGDIKIDASAITVGGAVYPTSPDLYLTQSGEKHTVTVEKKDAHLILDGVEPDMQMILPADFAGIIEDASGRPIQVVRVETPYPDKDASLYVDGMRYDMHTDLDGNFTIILTCTDHTVGVTVDGIEYRMDRKIAVSSATKAICLTDMSCVLDLSKGDVSVREDGFTVGDTALTFDGDYLVVQSGEEKGSMELLSGSVTVVIDTDVADLFDMAVEDDFAGEILQNGQNLYGVTLQTPFLGAYVTAMVDGESCRVLTGGDGVVHFLLTEGTHTVILSDGTVSYMATVTVTGHNAAEVSDEAVLVDTSKGDVVIGDGMFSVGDTTYVYDGEITLIQTGEQHGEVTVTDPDAQIVVGSDVDSDIKVTVPDDFEGSLKAEDGSSLIHVRVPIGEPGEEVRVTVGENEFSCTTDGEGNIDLLIPENTEHITVVIGDKKYIYPIVDGNVLEPAIVMPVINVTGEGIAVSGGSVTIRADAAPSVEGNSLSYQWQKDGELLEAYTGSTVTISPVTLEDAGIYRIIITESNGLTAEAEFTLKVVEKIPDQNPGSSGGSSDSGSSGSSSGSGPSGGGNAAGGSSGAAGEGTSGTEPSKPGMDAGADTGNGSDGSGENTITAPDAKKVISGKFNVKGLKLVKAGCKNTYKKYYRKNVKLKIKKEQGCKYYYKVVKKGVHNKNVKWKLLKGDTVTVKTSKAGKRIFVKCVYPDGSSCIRKSTGFYVDKKAPVVKGVKNKAVYKKPVVIRVSDNGKLRVVKLNGKTIKSGTKVSKKGTYKLTAIDAAGNKKTVVFRIV